MRKNRLLQVFLLGLLCTLAVQTSGAQNYIRTGKVTGDNGEPLSGASVTEKGTANTTTTNADGNFTINVTREKSVLMISFVGYSGQEVTTGNGALLTIQLSQDSKSLNAVVVTGYGTQRKKDITGSVSVVNIANLKQIPTGSVAQAMQGQASGVQVVTSGAPGGGNTIRVRGVTSLGNIDPLVLVDGSPGNMNDLNINDIESIQVLKDAGAAAIYGVRGANGVIIITTKRGRPGKARVTYDSYYGTQRPLKNGFNIANTPETAQAYYNQYKNSGLPFTHPQFSRGATTGPVIPDYTIPTAGIEGDPKTDPSMYALYINQITRANKVGTDWFHEVFKPAPVQSHSVAVSAGSEKSNYYFSLGYFNQQGTLLETYLKRYSARINTQFAIGAHNRIRMGENMYAFLRNNPPFLNQRDNNPIGASYRMNPLIPVYDIMGNFAGTLAQGLGNATNPVANLKRTHNNKINQFQLQGNAFVEADILKELTVRTQFGGTIDNYYSNSFLYTPYESASNNRNANSFTENSGYNHSLIWTNTVTYSNKFARHTVKALIGTEAIQNNGRGVTGSRTGYFLTNPGSLTVDPNLFTLGFGPPAGQTTGNISGPYKNALYSQFARVDYNFDDKYLLSGTLRRDGSSVFAPDVRHGLFPSVTAGWRISKESFMKDISWVDDLKIRGGWGKLGSNSNVSPNNAFTLYSQNPNNSYYDLNGANSASVLGVYASQLGGTNTTWEQDMITNIGFDAALLNNRFDVAIEWYKKSITGLLFAPQPYTGSLYAAQPAINAGNIENKGIDASVTYHGSIRQDLSFDVTGTFTSYHNKVIALPPGVKYYDRVSAGGNRQGGTGYTRIQAGEAVGAFYGYKVIGLFRDANDVTKSPTQAGAEPGLLKFEDGDGNGRIDVNDRAFFGNPNPKFTAGLNLALKYKGIDVSTFLYASVGNDIINMTRYFTDFPQVSDGSVSKDAVYNSWTPENLNARVPKLIRSSTFSNAINFSSYFLENGSYLRMKSLIVGYSLPASALSRSGINRLRLYGQIANLFTKTRYSGLDPELTPSNLTDNSNFGIDFGNYPSNERNFIIGINLSF